MTDKAWFEDRIQLAAAALKKIDPKAAWLVAVAKSGEMTEVAVGSNVENRAEFLEAIADADEDIEHRDTTETSGLN